MLYNVLDACFHNYMLVTSISLHVVYVLPYILSIYPPRSDIFSDTLEGGGLSRYFTLIY